ncbi:MAG: Gfo/Idh/MocA family oxidoreductase [bacterium]|nr:Gfo/Idh/MocA family oxidoreductase [bacterium]
MDRYRSAVIGCGRTAGLLEADPLRRKPATHMGHYRKSRRIRVVAGADTDTARRDAFRRQWRVTNVYADYREMLEREHPDIVSLTAFAPERRVMFKHCVEAGVKAVWIEKAIATSLREARSMVRLANKHGTITVVNHPRRWNPKYIRAKQLIETGAIGVPESIVSTFSGNLIHTGTHAFDIMRFFFGDVAAVQGTPDREGRSHEANRGRAALADVGASGSLHFASGVFGTINARAKDYFVFEFDIVGSQGAIRIGNSTPLTLYKPAPATYASQFEDLAPVDEAAVLPVRSKARQPTAVTDLLAGLSRGKQSVNSIHEGYKALEVALGFHESFAREGQWVTLPLKQSVLRIDSR